MSVEPTVESASPSPRESRVSEGLGWALVAIGAAWMVAALWAVLFVVGEDGGGTELITAILNALLPVLLLPPGVAIFRAGLRRVGPTDVGGRIRRLYRNWRT